MKYLFLQIMSYRFMRMILFFDLPSVSKKERRDYQKFIKTLKYKGFIMMQESVYTKLALNQSVATSTLLELKKELPADGHISLLTITEKQYASIEHLLGQYESDVINNDEKVIKL